ncbi:MAG: protein-L-isoaspartate O-methyltransferase, partial [Pseudomonadota bacterium]
VLAELSDHIYTVERIAPLLEQAQNVLGELGYTNITFKAFDGTLGLPEQAPFGAIIVTAGAPRIPQPLVKQLADGGRLVIPVGDRSSQDLIKVTKKGEDLIQKNLGGCRFVSLVGVHGWKE